MFPMRSKKGLVTLEQQGGMTARRWRVSFLNGNPPVSFGTLGRLCYVEHKNERLRNRARHELVRKFGEYLHDPFQYSTCDRFILQGVSTDLQTNLDDYEEKFYEYFLPLETRRSRCERKVAILNEYAMDLFRNTNELKEWNDEELSDRFKQEGFEYNPPDYFRLA